MEDKKVLSQSEVDALLGAFAEEEEQPATEHGVAKAPPQPRPVADRRKSVREYDFRRPSKLSKEHLRTLTGIHETLARVLTTQLSSQLRMAITVTVASVDQGVYDDFIRDVSESSIMNIVTLGSLPGAIIWEISEESTYAMVDRLLGGVGKPFQTAEREITDIELNLMRGIIERGLGALRDAWSSVVDTEPSLEEAVIGPQWVQIALPSDLTIVVILEIRLNEATGTMSLCIPYSVLEPIGSRLSTHALFAGRRPRSEGCGERIRSSLTSVEVNVTATVGSAEVPVRTLRGLRPGDVLTLDQTIHDPFRVAINGTDRFLGMPRRRGTRMAIQIVDRIRTNGSEGSTVEAEELNDG